MKRKAKAPPVTPGKRRQFDPWDSFSEMAKTGLYMPLLFSTQALDLSGELARIITGRSKLKPASNDKRFQDPAWQLNPIFKASLQAYLAWCQSLEKAIDQSGLSAEEKEEAKNAYLLLSQQLATNMTTASEKHPMQEFKSRGASLIQGVQRFSEDINSKEAPKKFTLGKDIACSKGQVVLRTPQAELIQYRPLTKEVRCTPILMVPSPLHRYYLYDLQPNNSLVQFLLNQGFQVFTISWFNPTRAEKHWDMDTYGQCLIDCIAAMTSITNSTECHLFGLAAGGLLAIMLASTQKHHAELALIRSLTLVTCGFDPKRFSPSNSLMSPQLLAACKTLVQFYGTIDANRMAELYAWTRPNSLIWNSRLLNYFSTKERPGADISFWNSQAPKIPAALHCDFIELFRHDALQQDEGYSFLGNPARMDGIDCPVYTLAGANDHLSPWEIIYKANQTIPTSKEFILVNQDHTGSLVCPPDQADTRIYTNDEFDLDAEDWLSESSQHDCSWWTHWQGWLNRHSAAMKPAPRKLGNKDYPATDKAPGKYVKN